MKILYLFFYFYLFNLIAIDLNFECGGTFRIDKEFLLSDGSKYSQFSNYGTCRDLGIYSYYCFGTFKTKDNIIMTLSFYVKILLVIMKRPGLKPEESLIQN